MLWIFGLMAISSFFVIGSWTRQAWRNRVPMSAFNAALMLSLGVDLSAIGLFMQTSIRAIDVMHGIPFPTKLPEIYFLGSALFIIGKSFLVWTAALGKGKSYSASLWWSYILSVTVFTAYCFL